MTLEHNSGRKGHGNPGEMESSFYSTTKIGKKEYYEDLTAVITSEHHCALLLLASR